MGIGWFVVFWEIEHGFEQTLCIDQLYCCAHWDPWPKRDYPYQGGVLQGPVSGNHGRWSSLIDMSYTW